MPFPSIALFKKNLLLKRRSFLLSLMEIVMPILLFWFLAMIPDLSSVGNDWVRPTIKNDMIILNEKNALSTKPRIGVVPSHHPFWDNIEDDIKDIYNNTIIIYRYDDIYDANNNIDNDNIEHIIEILDVPSNWFNTNNNSNNNNHNNDNINDNNINNSIIYTSKCDDKSTVCPTMPDQFVSSDYNNYNLTIPTLHAADKTNESNSTFSYVHYSPLPWGSPRPSELTQAVNINLIASPPYFRDVMGISSIDLYIQRRAMSISGLYPDSTSNQRDEMIHLTSFPMPALGYHSRPMWVLIIRAIATFLLVTIFLTLPSLQLIAAIVYEKELMVISLLRMMGMNTFISLLSWLLYYICTSLFTSLMGIMISFLYSDTEIGRSSRSLFFITYLLLQILPLSFGIMLSSLFKERKTSLQIGFITMVGVILVGVLNSQFGKGYSLPLDIILYSSTFGQLCNTISYLVTSGYTYSWDALNVSVPDGYSISTLFIIFMFQIIFYLILGAYIQVISGSDGTAGLPFYFPLVPKYWPCIPARSIVVDKRRGQDDTNINTTDTAYIQSPSQQEQDNIGLSISHLTKEFMGSSGPFLAVNNLSVDFYKGQISVLLGHNGAGKSTLVNQLCGLYQQTSGKITNYMSNNTISICPQYNALYPSLTVYEHMILYSSIKLHAQDNDEKLNSNDIHHEITTLLDMVGLTKDNKTDEYASTLSGGQKRKLCLAIALLHNNNNNKNNKNGGNNILILDEPSSGMDITAQRQLWELLKELKKDRILILTTHSLEEAEIADRISILAQGRLLCNGSSLFLKNKYGVGYTLQIQKVKHDEYDSNNNITYTQHGFGNQTLHQITTYSGQSIYDILSQSEYSEIITPLSDTQFNITFQIPFSASSRMGSFLRYIEQIKDELAMEHYTLSITTLSDVFFMANAHVDHDVASALKTASKPKESQSDGICSDSVPNTDKIDLNTDKNSNALPVPASANVDENSIWKTGHDMPFIQLLCIQISVLLYKRFIISLYSLQFWFQSYIIPVVLCLGVIYLSVPAPFVPVSMSPGAIQNASIVYNQQHTTDSTNIDTFSYKYMQQYSLLHGNTIQSNSLSSSSSSSSSHPYEYQLYLNNTYTLSEYNKPRINAMYPLSINNIDTLSPSLSCEIYTNTTQILPHISAITAIHQTLIDTVAYHYNNNNNSNSDSYHIYRPFTIQSYHHPYVYGNIDLNIESEVNNDIISHISSLRLSQTIFSSRHQGDNGSLSSQELSLSNLSKKKKAQLLSYIVSDIDDTNSPIQSSSSLPSPQSKKQPDIAQIISHITFTILFPVILLSICLSSAYYIVHERSLHIEHLQFISGTGPLSYWLSHLIFDLFILSTSLLIILSSTNILLNTNTINISYYQYIIGVLYYGLLVFPLTYIISFFCYNTAYVHIIIIISHFIIPTMLYNVIYNILRYKILADYIRLAFPIQWLTTYLLCIQGYSSTNIYILLCTGIISSLLWCIILSLLQYNRIYHIITSYIQSIFTRTYPLMNINNNTAHNNNNNNGTHDNSNNITTTSSIPTPSAINDNNTHNTKNNTPIESIDVIKQRRDITNGIYDNNPIEYPLVVDGLRKCYNNFTALNSSSFVLQRGTVTCLLGINGSGKSTTLGLITGEYIPSQSKSSSNTTNTNILSNQNKYDVQDKIKSQSNVHTARIVGYDIMRQPTLAWKHIGYCPQDDALNLDLTGRQQLYIYSHLRGVTGNACRQYIDHLLDTLDLTYAADRRIITYSLGMRRRLSIGVSLIGNPDLVILDECTTGVDPISKQRVYDLIKKTMSQRTVLLTSHDMDEIESICDNIIIMKHGIITALGTKQHLKNMYGDVYSIRIDCHNIITPLYVIHLIVNHIKDKIQFRADSLINIDTIMTSVSSSIATSNHTPSIKETETTPVTPPMPQPLNQQHFSILEILDRSCCINVSKDVYTQSELFDLMSYIQDKYSMYIQTYHISQVKLDDIFISLNKLDNISSNDRYM